MARGALTAEEDEAPALRTGCRLRMKILIVPAEVLLWFLSTEAAAYSASARAAMLWLVGTAGTGIFPHLPSFLGLKAPG